MNETLARDFEEGMYWAALDARQLTHSGICREIDRAERLLADDPSVRHMTDRYRSYLLGKVQGFRLEIGELA